MCVFGKIWWIPINIGLLLLQYAFVFTLIVINIRMTVVDVWHSNLSNYIYLKFSFKIVIVSLDSLLLSAFIDTATGMKIISE